MHEDVAHENVGHGNGQPEAAADKGMFRIGEVCRLTQTKAFVLRYWETEFPMLQPTKTPKGHRLYRRQDVDTVLHIKRLLYDEGFTIAGARRHLREGGGASGEGAAPGPGLASGSASGSGSGEMAHEPAPAAINRKLLLDLRDALRAFLTVLESE